MLVRAIFQRPNVFLHDEDSRELIASMYARCCRTSKIDLKTINNDVYFYTFGDPTYHALDDKRVTPDAIAGCHVCCVVEPRVANGSFYLKVSKIRVRNWE